MTLSEATQPGRFQKRLALRAVCQAEEQELLSSQRGDLEGSSQRPTVSTVVSSKQIFLHRSHLNVAMSEFLSSSWLDINC